MYLSKRWCTGLFYIALYPFKIGRSPNFTEQREAEKNAPIVICIARCLVFIHAALQWVGAPPSRSSVPNHADYLFVRNNDGFKKVAASTICYMEAASSYCQIHLTNDRMILVSIPLSEVIKLLSTKCFIRIDRSFSVLLLYVDSFIGNTLVMEKRNKAAHRQRIPKNGDRRIYAYRNKNCKYSI